MENDNVWSTTDLNKFVYQQTKLLCEANDFVLSPRRAKTLVRIKGHLIQIVRPEISYSHTEIRFGVSPTTSFNNVIFADNVVFPRKTNDSGVKFFNNYYMVGIDRNNIKWIYDSARMKAVWEEVVGPQIKTEVISVLDSIGFEQYFSLCEHRRCGILRCGINPGTDNAVWHMARGHNRIWEGRITESVPLLEQALQGNKKYIDSYKDSGDIDPCIQEEYSSIQELLMIVRNEDTEMDTRVLNHMQGLEQIALNKTWGVALSPERKTIRLKKKELL